jgi:hypothetical protein
MHKVTSLSQMCGHDVITIIDVLQSRICLSFIYNFPDVIHKLSRV